MSTSTTVTTAAVFADIGGLRRGPVLVTLAATGAMYGTGAGFLLEQSLAGTADGTWAMASDVSAALFGVSLVPLVGGVVSELDHAGSRASRQARTVGFLSAGLVTAGSTWLVVGASGVVPDAEGVGLAAQLLGLGGLGGWLVYAGTESLRTRRWGRVAGWAGVAAGTGHLVGGAAAALQMFANPLLAVGYSVSSVGFVTFLISLLKETR